MKIKLKTLRLFRARNVSQVNTLPAYFAQLDHNVYVHCFYVKDNIEQIRTYVYALGSR